MRYGAAVKVRSISGRHSVSRTSDGQVVIRIEGTFDFELARAVIRETKASMAAKPRALVIELFRVTDIFSFSLGALKLLCDQVNEHQSTIRLVECSPYVTGLFEPGILGSTFAHTKVVMQS
jgi:anti-anti-sigma factor